MTDQPQIDFDLKSYLPVLATVYGEAGGEAREDKIHVISSILNRAESGKAEFGADTGKISDVLNRGYYAYSTKSNKFMEAMNQKFPDAQSEEAFKEVVALFSGVLKGKIKREDSVFFLTQKEVNEQKKMYAESKGKRGMNMDLLEETFGGKKHKYFSYKKSKATRELANKYDKEDIKPVKMKSKDDVDYSNEGTFRKAFAKANKSGAKSFMWLGKKYSTDVK